MQTTRIVMALLASVASAAAAQTSRPPTDPKANPPAATDRSPDTPLDHHQGFMFGFSLGAGSVVSSACDDCRRPRAMGVDASVGWFVRPRIALMYNVYANITAEARDGASTAIALQSFAVQYWVTPALWLKGGIGAARFLVATPFGSARRPVRV